MSHRVLYLLPLLVSLACADLNYSDAGPYANADSSSQPPSTRPTTATVAQTERPLSWSELVALAREDQQRGELEDARKRLAQAAMQLQLRPPSDTRRRTVFGLQARLAMTFADVGRIEEADEYADELFAIAEAEPELGGDALVTLAYSVAERRQAATTEGDDSASQLELYRIALRTAQAGPADRGRMNLAYQVATQAYRESDLDLARAAIDQSIADAALIIPTYRDEIASMQIFKAHIALAQQDFEAAEEAAIAANVLYEEIAAGSARRGIGEALLAHALAEQGDLDRALALVGGAHARLDVGEPISDPARRQILASLARVERINGEFEAARIHLEEALAIDETEQVLDQMLTNSITLELQALKDSESSDSSDDE